MYIFVYRIDDDNDDDIMVYIYMREREKQTTMMRKNRKIHEAY